MRTLPRSATGAAKACLHILERLTDPLPTGVHLRARKTCQVALLLYMLASVPYNAWVVSFSLAGIYFLRGVRSVACAVMSCSLQCSLLALLIGALVRFFVPRGGCPGAPLAGL
jgi:hypothetical protein